MKSVQWFQTRRWKFEIPLGSNVKGVAWWLYIRSANKLSIMYKTINQLFLQNKHFYPFFYIWQVDFHNLVQIRTHNSPWLHIKILITTKNKNLVMNHLLIISAKFALVWNLFSGFRKKMIMLKVNKQWRMQKNDKSSHGPLGKVS